MNLLVLIVALVALSLIIATAAARLNAHRNTVLNRVGRAEELLGHPLGERRLAVALALELTSRLGARALPRSG